MSVSPEKFFADFCKNQVSEFTPLPQSGSSRKNFLAASNGKKYVITENENTQENESFLYFSEVFHRLHLNTPEIYSVSDDREIYIQEFLGSETLSQVIEKEGLSENVKNLVKTSLLHLQQLQEKTSGKIDYSKTFEYEAYDEYPVTYDLFYFKFMFADILGVQYHKTRLLKEFKNIVSLVESLEPKGLMIRDFQSRNIMVGENGKIGFIDYQSAMKGPLMYDVVSFLYQAKANFPESFRNEMLEYYYALWNDERKTIQLKSSLKPLQLMRFLQVLGAYGFRGLVQRKPHFVNSIQKGLENLTELSEDWETMKDFPELKNIVHQLNSGKCQKEISGILHQEK